MGWRHLLAAATLATWAGCAWRDAVPPSVPGGAPGDYVESGESLPNRGATPAPIGEAARFDAARPSGERFGVQAAQHVDPTGESLWPEGFQSKLYQPPPQPPPSPPSKSPGRAAGGGWLRFVRHRLNAEDAEATPTETPEGSDARPSGRGSAGLRWPTSVERPAAVPVAPADSQARLIAARPIPTAAPPDSLPNPLAVETLRTTPPTPSHSELPLDLASALAMVEGRSPRVAFAAARHRESYARLLGAEGLWLPSIRVGLSYHHHDGNLQASGGNLVDVSRSSLQAGLGAQAVGAGTTPVPGVVAQFHIADAWFQPRIENHGVAAQGAGLRRVTDETLLETALAYLELLRTSQERSIAAATLQRADEMSKLTSKFAASGEGSLADADRARTEFLRRHNSQTAAEESRRVAALRLAELLRLDPAQDVAPQEPQIAPIHLVALETSDAELIGVGLRQRPDLAEAQALVCQALERHRRERYAPFVPSVLLGVSQSTFGGGLGAALSNFDDRFDLDGAAVWEIRNLGVGEMARRDETRAAYDRTTARRIQTMDRVAREIAEAATQGRSRLAQIDVAQEAVQTAADAYRRDLQRVKEGVAAPLELLQSSDAIDQAQRELLRTVAGYNEAQFRLQRALGWPLQGTHGA